MAKNDPFKRIAVSIYFLDTRYPDFFPCVSLPKCRVQFFFRPDLLHKVYNKNAVVIHPGILP